MVSTRGSASRASSHEPEASQAGSQVSRMSTRRSTRGTSRAASNRGASPAFSQVDIPDTPARRSGRGPRSNVSSAPLPNVNARGNSAYGTNSEVQPTQLPGPEVRDGQEVILQDILGAGRANLPLVEEEDEDNELPAPRQATAPSTSSRRSRRNQLAITPTPNPNQTFGMESSVFGGAGLQSSSVSNTPASRANRSHRLADDSSRVSNATVRQQLPQVHALAQGTRVGADADIPLAIPPPPTWWERTLDHLDNARQWFVDTVASVFNAFIRWISTGHGIFLFCLLGSILFLTLTDPKYSASGKFFPKIGQWFPSSSKDSSGQYLPDDIFQLNRRIGNVEYEIQQLKNFKSMDSVTLERLEELLPNTIVCKKDKNGNLQIPDDFWAALQDKIRSDAVLIDSSAEQLSSSDTSSKKLKYLARVEAEYVVNHSQKVWDTFLENNKERILQWRKPASSGGDDSFVGDTRMTRDEFIRKIQQNWVENEKTRLEVKSQVEELVKRFENNLTQMRQLVTRSEVKAIVNDHVKRMIATSQLDSLSKANRKVMADAGFNRINWFSPGTGAVVVPGLTSPDYLFPSMNRNTFARAYHSMFVRPVPRPKPAVTALTRWEENGECWCSPLEGPNPNGLGMGLGVIISQPIHPDHVIIENIHPGSTLEPGSTPRDMELLAVIKDPVALNLARQKSRGFFPDHGDVPDGLVRLGSWSYDATLVEQNVQSFPLQVDLKDIPNAFTDTVMVRVKSNWGGEDVKYSCLYRVRLLGERIEGSK